ncbi:hypothetical protein BWZ22_00595 [Seonamhaeicola sp. S2-3]|uniref:hypothetical protein n=1 Tax=Seonamhaeicola sp. S2-3 TaxID=1936081 RepID=UPI000972AC5F|nr:hypothetical protein [Seonamhaeicola sp. S2-3]APY09834.1 hypothetical protein BWZ22_00595 [Seonamhaeicola sp. S2-3]
MKTTKTPFNLKKFIYVLIFPLVIGTYGCSNNDDGDDNPTGVCNEVISSATKFSNALTSYQQNPSETTCNNLKNTALDYIEALQDCQKYTEQYGDLEEAAEGYRNLDCSEI